MMVMEGVAHLLLLLLCFTSAAGKCHLGCQDGWTGFYCNISCQTVCVNTACSRETNECIECKNYKSGGCENSKSCFNVCEQCNKDGECTAKSIGSSETIVAAIVGVVGAILILLILLVAVVIYKKWFCKPQGDYGSQEHDAENLTLQERNSPQSDAGHLSEKFPLR
ncbi:uncharacterized protein LOC124114660 isoform X2 [Haliotis rufescens]|uniref:uncharacterized protein LOC124114660 isoform X2 n=1 Tax=Haliotis rufescens TaxID=6454 RepID=UPI001EB079B8|nr:uncharacterized protein LOC124114660 isoform X2 [Haliotis rufescens]